MAQLSGAPKIVGEIIDRSNIKLGRLIGPATIIGKTLWGPIGVPTLVTGPSDFRRKFGGLVSYSDFPYAVMKALANGGVFYIIREGHYTDPSDASTLTAVKATGTIGGTPPDVTFSATWEGEWGNSLKVTTSAAASGRANYVDILVENTAAGYGDLDRLVQDVPDTPDAKEIARVNSILEYVTLDSFTTSIPVGNVTLTTGAYDNASIVAADIIGNAGEGTGIYAVGGISDSPRIAAPEWADGDIDNALVALVEERFDMRTITRTPLGLTKAGVEDYREGTSGTYTHTRINSWHADLWTGGLVTTDDDGVKKTTTAMLAILAAMSRRDTDGAVNISASANSYRKISYGVDVAYDFGQGGRQADFDSIYSKGVNAVIMDGGLPVLHGNRTMWDDPTLLQKSNVADFLVDFYRKIRPLIRQDQFQPNDPIMWLELYNLILPVLNQAILDRAITEDFIYEGDQFVDSSEDVQYNNPADITAGRYYFRILVKPIPATEYIGYRIGVFNTGVDFQVETAA